MSSARTALVMALLWLAAVPARGEEPRPTVAFDLSGLSEDAFRRLDALSLERRAVLRLVQDGLAVVAVTARPMVVVRVLETPTGVLVEAESAAHRESREVAVGSERLVEVHLEIVQKAAELASAAVRRLAAQGPQPQPLPVPPSPPPAGPPPVVTAAPAPSPWLGLEPWAAASALVRSGGTDVLTQLGLRVGLGRALAVGVCWGVAVGPANAIDVAEYQVLAGPSYRLGLGKRASAEAALLAGVLVHTFSVHDPAALDRTGTRTDFLASLPLTLEYRPVRQLGLAVRVAPGVASEAREHDLEGTRLWARGRYRLDAGLMVTWRAR